MSNTDTQNESDPLLDWWQSPLGQCVLEQERQKLQSLANHFHGYYQIQIGVEDNLLPEMTMPKFKKRMAASADLIGSNEALPFKSNSVDTIVLPHVLEFSSDPHQVLREAERVLVGDGTAIICCFNPWSWWGIRRMFSCKTLPPWHGHFFGKTRVKDWLALLNFDVVACEKVMYRPPIQTEKWLSRTEKLEKIGRRFGPMFGGVTIMIASKRTVPLTPVAQRWRRAPLFTKKRLVTKPATREKMNGPS